MKCGKPYCVCVGQCFAEQSPLQAAQPQADIAGFKVVLDPSIPKGEAHAMVGGETVGQIVGIAQPQAPEIDCRQCELYPGKHATELRCKDCTNGDKFTKLTPVQLYRRGV